MPVRRPALTQKWILCLSREMVFTWQAVAVADEYLMVLQSRTLASTPCSIKVLQFRYVTDQKKS
jgi:hypothetical protein